MMYDTYVGTEHGVHRLRAGRAQSLGLENLKISAIFAGREASGDTYILAGSYGAGMFRSADDGHTWQPIYAGLPAPAFRTIDVHPLNPRELICGCEPGRIYTSADAGRTWSEVAGIRNIPGIDEWYLPYSPRAGAVRNIHAPDPSSARLLASVEVGGLLDSRDGGVTWTCSQVGVDDDIHHITSHPDDPNLLYASLGYAALRRHRRPADGSGHPRLGGVARSRDGGATWEKLFSDYTRATIVPPTRRDLVLSGPAPYVGEAGRIDVSDDGGDNWQAASTGIETPMPDMVELFVVASDQTIWAVRSGGGLIRAEAGEWHWHSTLPEDSNLKVNAVAFLNV
ncbi:MAG: hypothetical protein DCC58_15545 [Chloroflexi bacterium]|nr:MAG: hypothetical protein DCC58_15545 [Chloroflexota bacterium]